jgi:hypothetical protein
MLYEPKAEGGSCCYRSKALRAFSFTVASPWLMRICGDSFLLGAPIPNLLLNKQEFTVLQCSGMRSLLSSAALSNRNLDG